LTFQSSVHWEIANISFSTHVWKIDISVHHAAQSIVREGRAIHERFQLIAEFRLSTPDSPPLKRH
jgi:hypothetical protein